MARGLIQLWLNKSLYVTKIYFSALGSLCDSAPVPPHTRRTDRTERSLTCATGNKC